MGLDMYLYTASKELAKRVNEFNVEHGYISPEFNWQQKVCLEQGEIGYWRKFWPLHRYFVNAIQHGQDDCGYYEIEDLDVLKDCRDKLQYALDHREYTECEFAPEARSCFDVTIDHDWHWKDIKYTIDLFDFLLENLEMDNSGWNYFVKDEEPAWNPRLMYRASW